MGSFAKFERFTGQARRAVWLAYREAERCEQDFLSTEHLLAGLLRDGASEIAAMLREQAIEPERVLIAVERSLQEQPATVSSSGSMSLTPRLVRTLVSAVSFRDTMNPPIEIEKCKAIQYSHVVFTALITALAVIWCLAARWPR